MKISAQSLIDLMEILTSSKEIHIFSNNSLESLYKSRIFWGYAFIAGSLGRPPEAHEFL